MQKWILLGILSIVLVVVGLGMNFFTHRVIKNKLAQELNVNLENTCMILELWIEAQKSAATSKGLENKVRIITQKFMASYNENTTKKNILDSIFLKEIRQHLAPMCRTYGYTDFAIVTNDKIIVASLKDRLINSSAALFLPKFIDRVLLGETCVSSPFLSNILKSSNHDKEQPLILSGTPLRNTSSEIIGALIFGIQPQMDFSTIFQVGSTSNNYAFDGNGWLLTNSRFDEQLRDIGLISKKDLNPIYKIQIKDPLQELKKGNIITNTNWPYTYSITKAIEGSKGFNVEGYRDFRGVPVIGAWTWLKEYNIGIVSEIDKDEAYATLYSFRKAFWYLFGLLTVYSFILLILLYIIMHFYKKAKQALQFGQYKIIEKIGKGGMGEVYKATHATLRRITALKLIQPQHISKKNIKRFEQEVQLTSRLTHPNTIAVYDYGRTPKGIFYYAMEYLPGITLSDLIYQNGAIEQERAVHFLIQVCSSVAEAHSIGLIHRDIKPANIMIGERGGIYDFIKVLDFGLARKVKDSEINYEQENGIYGSPHYIAPEALKNSEKIDQKCDIYAIGAVGYYLITGQHVFIGKDAAEVCMHQVKTKPIPLSERLNKPVNSNLEDIIMRCLEKDPQKRPMNAQVLFQLLQDCKMNWEQDKAKMWWRQNAEDIYKDLDKNKIQPQAMDTITIDFTAPRHI